MSSTKVKPTQPPSSPKVGGGNPIGTILNQARSTLSQSRQFREPSSSTTTTTTKPQPNLDPNTRPPQSPSSSKLDINNTIRKPSLRKISSARLELNKQTSTLSMDSLMSGGSSNTQLRKQPSVISRSQFSSQRGQQDVLPQAQAPASTKQLSGANYDYDSIFSNATSSKRVGRSDFNIFKVGQNATANASTTTSNNKNESGSFGRPPPTPPANKPIKVLKKHDEDSSDDSSSYDESSTSGGQTTETEDDSDSDTDVDDGNEDVDDSTTITPPTITETSASKSKSLAGNTNPIGKTTPSPTPRRMSLKAITLDGENNYGSQSRSIPNSRKIVMQDFRDKPIIFSSHESNAVVKAMSPDRDDQDFIKDVFSLSKQFVDNPATPKSYTEDFVSEIQSIADDFSKSFARSVNNTSSNIEEPKTENSTEVPSTEISENDGGNSSHRKKSAKNAMNSLKIMNEIKGNLQDLEIMDIVDTFQENKAAAATGKFTNEDEDEQDDEYPEDLLIVETNNTTSSSTLASRTSSSKVVVASKSGKKRVESASSASNSSKKVTTTTNKRPPAIAKSPRNSAKILTPDSSDATAKNMAKMPIQPPQKKLQLPQKPPSRSSSRKNFQATLSQVKLQAEEDDDNNNLNSDEVSPALVAKPASEKEARAKKLEQLEQKYPYKTPKTKPQTQIHSILEKHVYRKELGRLRKESQKEEKELRLINQARYENYRKTLEVLEKKGKSQNYRQPSLNFPSETESDLASEGNWGAPYFNRDGSLSEGLAYENLPRTPTTDEKNRNYAAKVGNMNVPQLVREVLKSNERMYKMTVKAAKEMGKEYGRKDYLQGPRKIRDLQPPVKD